jgi:hypothetical protein
MRPEESVRKLSSIAVPLCLLALSAAAQNANDVRDRGRTRTQPTSQWFDRGRFGTQQPIPAGSVTLGGTLVDAGCADRTALNLSQPPLSLEAAAPAAASGGSSAPPDGGISNGGITVDRKTLEGERADAMAHQVPDMRTRQSDPTCSITGATQGFALLLDNGRLLNLGEAGNTFAMEAVYSTPAGRAMLSGAGPGVKPRVTVTGRTFGDRFLVESVHVTR